MGLSAPEDWIRRAAVETRRVSLLFPFILQKRAIASC